MSEKVERKLRDVVLARYEYRHEAEFAAGFLDDAGIPYRLQIDDPAMGLTIATPATIWVRGMDVRAALEVLHLPERPEHEASYLAAADATDDGDDEGRNVGVDVTGSADAGTAHVGRLTGLQRVLGVGLLVAAASTTLVPEMGGVVVGTLVALALPFGVAGVVGRALGPVRSVLRAISGSAD